MKIAGLMLCRSEDWVLRCSMDAALRWVDHLVFLNHGSEDSSRTIAATYANSGKPVTIIDWHDGEHWMEMDARQRSLDAARSVGATHCAIIDCDEVPTATALPRLREWMGALKPTECLDVPMIAPWKSLDVYSYGTQSPLTLGFCDHHSLSWMPRGEEKYHYHNRPPQGTTTRLQAPISRDDGGIMHLQYAAWSRFTWKHRHYMMSERLRWPQYKLADINEKYHWWEKPPHGEDLRPVPPEWWDGLARDKINLTAEGWHSRECHRMIETYGAKKFHGLELLGWTP